jgi:hypothetical protein
MTALLAFDRLSKDWFGVPAVREFTMTVEQGSVLVTETMKSSAYFEQEGRKRPSAAPQ